MWITRKAYDDLRLEWAKTHEEATVLNRNYTALMTTMDWLRVRVTQLEQERAQLLFNYTGVKVPTPRIEREHAAEVAHPPHFDDIGDAEAARLGITWDEAGNVVYMQSEK